MRRTPVKTDSPFERTWLGTDAKVVRHVQVLGAGYLASATRLELARLGVHRQTDSELPALFPPLVIACSDSELDTSFQESMHRLLELGPPLLLAGLVGRVIRIGPLIESRAPSFPHPQVPGAETDPTAPLYMSDASVYMSVPSAASNPPTTASSQGVRDAAVDDAYGPAPRDPGRDSGSPHERAPPPPDRSPHERGPPPPDRTPHKRDRRHPTPAQHEPAPPLPYGSLYARAGALLVAAQALNFLLGARHLCLLDRVVELNPFTLESKAYRVLKVRQ